MSHLGTIGRSDGEVGGLHSLPGDLQSASVPPVVGAILRRVEAMGGAIMKIAADDVLVDFEWRSHWNR